MNLASTRLMRACMAGLLSLLVPVALAACGSSSSSGHSSSPSASTSSSGRYPPSGVKVTDLTPAAKGRVSSVTWDLPFGEPYSLDPLKAYALPDNSVLANTCDSLMRIEPNLSIGPGLATAMVHTAPNTWVITVRSGVKFWNGKPMTTGDVVYNLQRQANPKNASFYSGFSDDIVKVAQSGPNKVRLTTRKPNELLRGEMATGLGAIAEPAYIESHGSSYGTPKGGIMCTGPFEFVRWVSGDEIVLKRNPSYWDRALEPKVDTITFKFITSAPTIVSGLLSGQLDGTYEVPIQGMSQLQNSAIGRVYFGQNLIYDGLVALSHGGVYSNPLIRKALAYAIDVPGIVKAVYNGYASPLYWPVGPDIFGYAKSTWMAAYDQTKLIPASPRLSEAKSLVKKAGSPKGPIVIAAQAGDSQTTAMANAIQSAGQEIGLNVQVKLVQPSVFNALSLSASARKGLDAYVGTNYYLDQADPLTALFYNYTSAGEFNDDGYSNRTVDRLVAEALATDNPQRRAAIGARAAKIAFEHYDILPLVQYPQRVFLNKRITGAPTSFPTFAYYPWAALIGASN